MDWDRALFRWVNGWPDSWSPFFIFFSESNKWLAMRLLLLAIAAYCAWRKDLRPALIIALLGFLIGNELCDILKETFRLLRPSVDLPDAIIRTPRLTSFGTASAHSSNMMATAVAFLPANRKWGYAWLAVAFITGISRIYVGAHYPAQVILGWTMGATVSALLWLIYVKAIRKPSSSPDPVESPAEAL